MTRDAAAAGVPAALALAVIDHESGGDWAASHRNANGTTDAGLMQVNSANWAAYGLGGDANFGQLGHLFRSKAATPPRSPLVMPLSSVPRAPVRPAAPKWVAGEERNGWPTGSEAGSRP